MWGLVLSQLEVPVKQGNSNCAFCSKPAVWVLGMVDEGKIGIGALYCSKHLIEKIAALDKLLQTKGLKS